jgi:hypothetical protein
MHLRMPLTFNAEDFAALTIELNCRLVPIGISRDKGTPFRRPAVDEQTFDTAVQMITLRKDAITHKCQFYQTVLAGLQLYTATEYGGKKIYRYDLLECKELYTTQSHDTHDNWRYLDYLVWDILYHCNELLKGLSDPPAARLSGVLLPFAHEKERLIRCLQSYQAKLNYTIEHRTISFIQDAERIMRGSEPEELDTRRKLLKVFIVQNDNHIEHRDRYIKEYRFFNDLPVTHRNITHGATSIRTALTTPTTLTHLLSELQLLADPRMGSSRSMGSPSRFSSVFTDRGTVSVLVPISSVPISRWHTCIYILKTKEDMLI